MGEAEAGVFAVAKGRVGLVQRVRSALSGEKGERTSCRLNITPIAAVKRKKALRMFGRAKGKRIIHPTPSLPPSDDPGPKSEG